MKKLFISLMMVVTMFVAGVTLSACGSKMVKLTFSVESESEPLVKLVVKQNDVEVEGRGYNYNLQKGLNLRVEIIAKTCGVDFSQLIVKVNGLDKSIITNRNYDCSKDSTDYVYGNFTLADIQENLDVSIQGVRQMNVTYGFEIENADDETAVANMQNAYIDVDGNGQYVNFYEFVSNPESKLERSFSNEDYNSFNLRFGDAEKGDDIFNLYGTKSIRLRSSQGVETDALFSFTTSGNNIVSFSNIKEKEYTIVVDFKDLSYKEYSIVKPNDNLNYSIEVPVSTNFMTEKTLIVKKSDKRESLVYDNIKVYLNNKSLEIAEDCDLQNDTNLRFIIPKGITPFSTSQYGDAYYTVRVEGISYKDESFDVTFLQNSEVEQQSVINTKFYLLDEQGEPLGEIPQENGKYVVAKGEKVALFWQYKFNEELGVLVSKFNLYDFDVLATERILVQNDVVTPEVSAENGEDNSSEKEPEENPNPDIPPVVEEPIYETKSSTYSLFDKIDFALKETQTIVLDENYTLKVFFNEERQVFDSMQLEFSCENEKELAFDNFKTYSQEVNIAYDFESEVVSGVEYFVDASAETEWESLQKGEDKKLRVEAGQKIVFRLRGTGYVEETQFKIENDHIVTNQVGYNSYQQDGVFYSEFRFIISDNQFEELQSLKLVSVEG